MKASSNAAAQRKPDFFIVGAPKAGTEALRTHLLRYDEVYMPTPEEPNYFCGDINPAAAIRDEEWYLQKYFSGATGASLIGEKSTWYLCSSTAAYRLARFQPQAKIIVMLRNPVELVQSFHQEMVYVGAEDQVDFLSAWNLQDKRKAGQCLPVRCHNPKLLQYEEVVKLGDQLERYMEEFPSDRLFVRATDDFRSGRTFVEDLEKFLGLRGREFEDIPKKNEAKRVRSSKLDRILRPPDWAQAAADDVKNALGVRRLGLGLALRYARQKLNTRPSPRPELPPHVRQELNALLAPQVLKLERLTGRSFSHWIGS